MPPDETSVQAEIVRYVSSSTSALTTIALQVAVRLQTYFIYLQTILDMSWITAQAGVITLLSSISVWLEALYLDYFIEMSHAADISLSAHRELQVQMLIRIGDFSWAIGCEVCFIPNALQVVRGIFLNSHASLGRRFLYVDIDWMLEQDKILQTLYQFEDYYIEQPERIYATFDYLITQYAIDAQADGELFTASIIKRMGYVIGKQQQQIEDFDYKLWLLEDNIANALTQGLENVLVAANEQFTQWQENVYTPQVAQFNEQFAGIANNIAAINDKLVLIDERLNLAGDLLYSVMDLREPVRTEQLAKISNTVLQLYSLDVFNWAALVEHKTE